MSAQKTIHEHFLNNGLKLIIKEDHRAPVAIMQVWYKVGSSYEVNGTTGVSHALEHMMFRGSKQYRGSQYDTIISENGGQNNAFTGQDYTVYHQFIANDKLEICFKLEADRMHQLLLTEKNFKKEISVVMEERYQSIDDNPHQRAYERFAATAHVASPYRHSIIGWMDDLQQMTVEDLQHWYQTWYVPNNAIIIVVGDVAPRQIWHWAKKYFGFIKARPIPKVKPQNEVLPLGMRNVTIKTPAKLPWLALGYNTPVLKTVTATKRWEPYALVAASGILGLTNSARLQKNIVRKKQIASSAYSFYTPFDRLDNLFMLGATPIHVKNIESCKAALLQEVEHLQTHLVSRKELERIKLAWVADKIFSKDSLFNQAYEIGTFECVGFSWREMELTIIKHIQSVTPKQIKEVALSYLTPERLTVGILEPLQMKAIRA